MELNFKEFSHKEDLAKQREMFTLCFPETVGQHSESNEHYLWKFHSYPNSPHSYEYSVFESDNILGYYAALPYKYRVNDEVLTAGMVCDVMTHPNARGKGVFTKIGAFATDSLKEKNVHFTTGYPIRPEVIPGHLKVGWEAPFKLPMLLKPLKANDILNSKKVGFLSFLINPLIFLFNLVINLITPKNSKIKFKCLNYNEFLNLEAYKTFIEKWYKNQKFCLIKDHDFLKWRLGSKSEDYKIICAFDGEELVAVSIAKATPLNDIKSFALLDLMILPGIKNLENSMLDEITRMALIEKTQVIAIMISNHWIKKYSLLRNGFLKTPFQFTFISKLLNVSIDTKQFLEEENWHLTWIDSDDL